jgi:hypothetical protein
MDIPSQLERQLETSGITPNLMYQLPPDSTTVETRKTVKLSPESGGGDDLLGGSNSVIRFRVRGGDFIDTESLYCSVNYKQDDENTTLKPPNGLECLISEIRLRSGTGAAIETITDVGLLSNILINYSHSKTHIQTVHTIGGGGEEYADRMGKEANKYEQLSFKLPSGFLNTVGKYVDTNLMKGLVIELQLYSPDIALFSTDADWTGLTVSKTPKYYWSNPELIYDEITVSSGYKKEYLMNLAKNGNIKLAYSTYTASQSPGSDSIRMSKSVSRLKDIITICRANSQITGNTRFKQDSLGVSTAITDNSQFTYLIGSHHAPVGGCKGAANIYTETLKTFGRMRDSYAGHVKLSEFKANKGIVSIDLELVPASMWSGMSTINTPEIVLTSQHLFPATSQVNSWLHHEMILELGNGTIEVYS